MTIQNHCDLDLDNFINIIDFILKNCYFSYNNSYIQTFGTPLDLPLSPVIAMIVMDHLLGQIIPQLNFHLPFIYKYVDVLSQPYPKIKSNTSYKHSTHLINIYNSR